MQAIVLEGINHPLRLQEVPDPVPAAGEVLVGLRAAALNHRDVWIQKGQYAGLRFPCILGSDGAGVVTDAGEGARSLIGQEVILNPGLFWGDDSRFPARDFRILGLPDDGTFAQRIRIPASHAHPKPAHLGFEPAAALPLAGLTAYRALFSRAGLRANEKVLVTGIGGGVALFALQFALAAGARTWVTSGSDEKLARANQLGAAGGANYHAVDWPKQLAAQASEDGKLPGFDVIIDSAGGEGFRNLIELAAPGGRIALFGGTRGAWKDISPQRVFYKQLTILGSTMGSASEFEAMIRFVTTNRLQPVVDRIFPLSQAEEALRRMDQAEQFGKLVLTMG
ncbi:MAG: zinc-binding dehydrogenase [Ferruginibacter sp.]|nr:zinc-binding dehydrogenase [Cytophagales bacterium]